ncbi:hypothetical protein [Streptomyces sp. NPDC020742]|uniref:hypothetical protein n=1 Tax=Streptomyces sp. NPDC020742 TaxID=3154897 RepID=UPI0033FA21D9
MVRNVLGSLIALAGATAAVWSPFRPWYDGRHGSDVRIEDLFNGITPNGAALFGSVLLPLAFAALLTLIGVAMRSRFLVALAGLVVLGFTILWMVRQGQAASELTAGARGLGVGVANALGGGALMLLGALIMSGRGRRAYDRGYDRHYDDRHYDDRRYDDQRYGEPPYDDGSYGRPGYDDRYVPRTPYPPAAYPPATPEPWDAGRPGAEEWDPEPYAAGPAGPPTGRAGAPYGQPEDTPTTPLPVTPPPTQQQRPQPPPPVQPQSQPAPPQPQSPQPPPPPPPPTMTAHRQAPTPPVEWGREQRQAPPPERPEAGRGGEAPPDADRTEGAGRQRPPQRPHRPEQPEQPQRPPEERK